MKSLVYLLPTLLLIACGGQSAQESSSNVASKAPAKMEAKPKGKTSEYFQGELHYQYDYTSESRNIGYIRSKRPKRGVFKYDLQHYQSIFYGVDTRSYYYSGIENKTLSSLNGAFEANCVDYSTNPDSLLFFEVHDTDVKIMGHACKVIEYQTANVYTRYHVSKEEFLPPDTYQHHVAYNWSLYGKHTNGGIILKAEHFFDQFNMIGDISEIVRYTNGERAWDISEQAFQDACR